MDGREENIQYIDCEICGRRVVKTAPNRKYCRGCAEKKKRSRKKGRAARAKLLDWHDLTGKSLARVDAEARAFGLSYGQYTAAVYSGGIDALLRSRGIEEPEERLRSLKCF